MIAFLVLAPITLTIHWELNQRITIIKFYPWSTIPDVPWSNVFPIVHSNLRFSMFPPRFPPFQVEMFHDFPKFPQQNPQNKSLSSQQAAVFSCQGSEPKIDQLQMIRVLPGEVIEDDARWCPPSYKLVIIPLTIDISPINHSWFLVITLLTINY